MHDNSVSDNTTAILLDSPKLQNTIPESIPCHSNDARPFPDTVITAPPDVGPALGDNPRIWTGSM